jgi:hypothetical protein
MVLRYAKMYDFDPGLLLACQHWAKLYDAVTLASFDTGLCR